MKKVREQRSMSMYNHCMRFIVFVAMSLSCSITLSDSKPGKLTNSESLTVTAFTARLSERQSPLVFTGIIEIKGLHDITATTRGIVRGLSYGKDAFNMDSTLLSIMPVDPNFTITVVSPPFNNARLVRRYVDNGHFVQENDLLVQIAQGQNYTAVFQVPSYEVESVRDAKYIEMTLYSPKGKKRSIPLGEKRVQYPVSGDTMYRVEIDVDCSGELACSQAQLSGALVSASIYSSPVMQLDIPRKALLNGETQVMLLSSENTVIYRKVELSGGDESKVTVVDGLKPGERVIVEYNRVPHLNEAPSIIKPAELGNPEISYQL